MHLTRPRRRMAMAAGLAAGLALAALPAAQAGGLLDSLTGTVEEAFAPQLVTVTADLAQRNVLANSGLDLTEHAGHDYVEVVLHTPADLALLRSLELPYEVRVPDLLQREAEVQAANRAYAASVAQSPMPSGRTGYRTLEDYNAEMQALADRARRHRQAARAAAPEHRGQDRVRRRDRRRRQRLGRGRRRAPHLRAHGPPPRPRVAVGRAHHGVRIRPRAGLRLGRRPHQAAGRAGPHRADPGRQRRRLREVRQRRHGPRPAAVNEYDPLDGTVSLATPNNAYKRKNCRPFDGVDGVPVSPATWPRARSATAWVST